jgi:hypothetical protein
LADKIGKRQNATVNIPSAVHAAYGVKIVSIRKMQEEKSYGPEKRM